VHAAVEAAVDVDVLLVGAADDVQGEVRVDVGIQTPERGRRLRGF